MAKNIADTQIRDTNTATFDIENSGDGSVTFVYVNGLDTDVTVVVKGTHDDDDDFSDSATLEAGKTVTNGTTDYDTMGYPWDQVRFEVTAASSPSSGSLAIKLME